MKFRGPIFFSLILVALIFGAFYIPANNAEKEAILIKSIIANLDRFHFQPQKVDDNFSQKVYDLYMDRIDGNRRWLTQQDVDQLGEFEMQLDDEADAGTYEFFDMSLTLIEKGLNKTEGYFKEILSKPFDFSTDETIDLSDEKKPFAKDDAELKENWRKYLKRETLTRVVDDLDLQKEGKDEDVKGKSFAELEQKAREDVLDVFDKWYTRMRKSKRADRLSNYLNAIANVYDPHTGYFKPRDKENFDIRMSKTLEGIGAQLRAEEEYTRVVSVIVGGPAWKGKQLEADDMIMAVAQGDDEPVDVSGMVIDDVVDMIRGKKGTEVRLTVKKKDGDKEVIAIERDVVIMEEGYAKSTLLSSPKNASEKMGYINLPSFYADFGRNGGHSCAEDVAKELKKLKKHNVDGIILDLRNNGGGSLEEVVDMAGLFIEKGPIVQVKSRIGRSGVHEDEDGKVLYDGPLIVMVNEYSASASEILAAALQDYGRAVIVGSTSTFGKGTVQRFLDLDRAVMGYADVKPLGSIKLTIQKYYRVNGGSVQLNGVKSDIVFPDLYSYFDLGEKDYDHALDYTEIAPVPYEQNVYSVTDKLDELRTASGKRVTTHPAFQQIETHAKWLKTQRDIDIYSLNIDKYTQMEKDQKEVNDAFKKVLDKKVEGMVVKNLPEDMDALTKDEGVEARNKDWMEGLEKDIYLNEVLSILRDME
ncbi:MAG: carboxyl-terminal processing protease [Granulosicoccus sp.]|jgi:carboxyl-terminal processing protease